MSTQAGSWICARPRRQPQPLMQAVPCCCTRAVHLIVGLQMGGVGLDEGGRGHVPHVAYLDHHSWPFTHWSKQAEELRRLSAGTAAPFPQNAAQAVGCCSTRMRNLGVVGHSQWPCGALSTHAALALIEAQHRDLAGQAHSGLTEQHVALQVHCPADEQLCLQYLPREEALFCAQASGVLSLTYQDASEDQAGVWL